MTTNNKNNIETECNGLALESIFRSEFRNATKFFGTLIDREEMKSGWISAHYEMKCSLSLVAEELRDSIASFGAHRIDKTSFRFTAPAIRHSSNSMGFNLLPSLKCRRMSSYMITSFRNYLDCTRVEKGSRFKNSRAAKRPVPNITEYCSTRRSIIDVIAITKRLTASLSLSPPLPLPSQLHGALSQPK